MAPLVDVNKASPHRARVRIGGRCAEAPISGDPPIGSDTEAMLHLQTTPEHQANGSGGSGGHTQGKGPDRPPNNVSGSGYLPRGRAQAHGQGRLSGRGKPASDLRIWIHQPDHRLG